MRHYFIHIGTHKTGTTSVQAYLHANRDGLLEQGFLYPGAFGQSFGHHQLAFLLRGGNPKLGDVPKLLEQGFAGLRHEIRASGMTRIILSSEELFALPKQRVEALARRLGPGRVTVVAMIRRPDRLFESAYNQRIKTAKNPLNESYKSFLGDPLSFVRDLRFDEMLSNWAGVFGRERMKVACYEDKPDAIDAVCDMIGVSRKSLPVKAARTNVGLSVRAAELVRLGKAQGLGANEIQQLFVYARNRWPKAKEKGGLLTPEERMQILEACEPVCEAAFTKFLSGPNRYAPKNFKLEDFPPQVSLDPEEAKAILMEFAE